jgi:F-type H+-transporting ATPase subunit alpha
MEGTDIQAVVRDLGRVLRDSFPGEESTLRLRQAASVRSVGESIARISALPEVRADELVRFAGNRLGMVFNVDVEELGIILLDPAAEIRVGTEVRRTGRVLDVPVGQDLIGRIIDALGRPLDGAGPVPAPERWPVERPATAIMDRAPVTVPVQTGLKVIDALVPVGRGQRELILGDRQSGKTAIALDTILNQRGKEMVCVYCAIGQRRSATAKVIADLRERGAMDYTIVLVAGGEDAPGQQFACAYAGMTIGEYFMEQGQDALVVFDDLTRHARAYRELSLLLRRPPGREAFPGDIFYIHSRLLERSTRLREERGGGSLTALPIIETQAQNISAYIPTNLISITDGQIYLSPDLFRKGHLPAIDVGRSVSRVGGKTQLPAYQSIAGELRLSYSQFEELEDFSRFGTRLDEDTRQTIEHGRRVREVLKQPQYEPLPVAEQIVVLLTVSEGLLDQVPLDQVTTQTRKIRDAVSRELPDLCRRLTGGAELDDEARQALLDQARDTLEQLSKD